MVIYIYAIYIYIFTHNKYGYTYIYICYIHNKYGYIYMLCIHNKYGYIFATYSYIYTQSVWLCMYIYVYMLYSDTYTHNKYGYIHIYMLHICYIYNVILLVYIYMSLKTNPKIPGGHHPWWRLGIPHFTKPTYSKHSHVPKTNPPSRVEVWQNLWNKENTWTRH